MYFVLKSQVELRLRQQKIGSFVKKEMCSVVDLGFIFLKRLSRRRLSNILICVSSSHESVVYDFIKHEFAPIKLWGSWIEKKMLFIHKNFEKKMLLNRLDWGSVNPNRFNTNSLLHNACFSSHVISHTKYLRIVYIDKIYKHPIKKSFFFLESKDHLDKKNHT